MTRCKRWDACVGPRDHEGSCLDEHGRGMPPPGGYGAPGGNGRIVHAIGATIVTCYGEPECLERFVTCSDLTSDPLLLDRQLTESKWQTSHNGKGKVFRCPAHALDLSTHVPLVYRGPKESPRAPGDRKCK
jgi:hypothetical protein